MWPAACPTSHVNKIFLVFDITKKKKPSTMNRRERGTQGGAVYCTVQSQPSKSVLDCPDFIRTLSGKNLKLFPERVYFKIQIIDFRDGQSEWCTTPPG